MFAKLFTWWNGSTLGALFDIRRRSRFVGEDEFGNRYFEDRRTSLGQEGFHRRYVVYKGLAEPSKIPPDWHGWLHHQTDAVPTGTSPYRQTWQREHQPNLTGTGSQYLPPGAIEQGGRRDRATGDYEPWTPS